jgi:phosphatidylinositol alpha 1,6-mannosyltransferase
MSASHGASPSDEANARRKDEMPRALRVALVAESFLPAINGVTNSVLRVANHLTRLGHICHIYAPSGGAPYVELGNGTRLPVTRIKSLPFPGYSSVRITLGKKDLDRALTAFRPDVIHLASPALLGRNALAYAERTKTPVVAIYQTDLVGFAEDYRIPFGPRAARRLVRSIHNKATMTLAPSTDAINALRENQIENVHYWPRGVDSLAFSPAHRDGALRSALAPRGELIVGFIGRLAPEKRPLDLVPISKLDGVKLVVVGDGPEARNLKAHTRGAMFFGELRGSALARVMASLDVLVHTGWHETFCQTVQESLASAVPVIAPPAGGPRDLVSHGKTGWLIDTKCPRTLADLVTQLRDNREQVRQKRPVARESVSARTWSKVGNALLEHYYQVLGEPVKAPTQKLATVTTLHESASTKETIDSVQQAA